MHPSVLVSHCSLWLVADLTFCRVSSYAKLGMSMETLLDPGRLFVQKGLPGGVDLRQL